jgi:hypothetical protein
MIFTPPFEGDPADIRREIRWLEKKYFERPVSYATDSKEADKMALAAGRRIKNGERTKENLKILFRWKNESSRFYASTLEPAFDRNTPQEIEAALTQAHEARTEAEAVAALTALSGVRVPTASAMLANIYPDRFTVMDQLTLRALGVVDAEIAFYLYYNATCMKLAKEYKVGVRTLDRALWEFGNRG